MDRREFLKRSLVAAAGAALWPWFRLSGNAAQAQEKGRAGAGASELVVARGGSPGDITRKAVEALGGMERFVRKGNRVLVKPNIAWDRTVDQAACTHPEVVKVLIEMCRKAGASRVVVTDNPCNPWSVTSVKSGIEAAVKAAGGDLHPPVRWRKITIPGTQVLKEAEILEEVLEADVIINVPVVKVHGSQARVTIAMKNWMGIVRDRGFFHRTDLNRCIAEIASFIRPHLTVLDATRVLLTRGPAGPGDVKVLDTVAAGVDFVALDALGCTFLGVEPESVRHIQIASEMGLGQSDLSKVTVRYV